MKRQAVLIILLIAVIAYAGYIYWPVASSYVSVWLGSPSKPGSLQPVRPKPKTAEPTAVVPATTEVTSEAAVEKKPAKADLVDPFALRIKVRGKSSSPQDESASTKTTEPEPTLEGIWVDSGMRVAFISGQAVVEGGLVMGWRVSRITKTQVTLTKGRRKKILKLEAIQ